MKACEREESQHVWDLLREMAEHPEEVGVITFFPYEQGVVLRERPSLGCDDPNRLSLGYEHGDLVDGLENALVKSSGKHRDNKISFTVQFRGRVHAILFWDWSCTLGLDREVQPRKRW